MVIKKLYTNGILQKPLPLSHGRGNIYFQATGLNKVKTKRLAVMGL